MKGKPCANSNKIEWENLKEEKYIIIKINKRKNEKYILNNK